jgi:hypothetical protein
MDFSFFLKNPNVFNVLGAENDAKQYSNILKFILNTKHKKKQTINTNYIHMGDFNHIQTTDPNNLFTSTIFNTENTLKFKDYKSSNAQFLGSERTTRLLNNLNSNSFK